MNGFFREIKDIQRNNRYYIVFGIQILCIVLYFVSIKDLERPAGIIETIKFCFMNPGGYFIAILVGIVAWFLFSVLLISNLMEIPTIKDILNCDDYYESYEDMSKVKIIVNIILCIIAFILNTLYLSYLMVLIVLLILLMAVVIIFTR